MPGASLSACSMSASETPPLWPRSASRLRTSWLSWCGMLLVPRLRQAHDLEGVFTVNLVHDRAPLLRRLGVTVSHFQDVGDHVDDRPGHALFRVFRGDAFLLAQVHVDL